MCRAFLQVFSAVEFLCRGLWVILFTEFEAGEVVDGLIGFSNTNTEKEFIVTVIEGSFRWPECVGVGVGVWVWVWVCGCGCVGVGVWKGVGVFVTLQNLCCICFITQISTRLQLLHTECKTLSVFCVYQLKCVKCVRHVILC